MLPNSLAGNALYRYRSRDRDSYGKTGGPVDRRTGGLGRQFDAV